MDETFIGGEEAGLRGGRQRGKKVLTGIAVEVREPKGIGRCRMAVLADGSAESLHPFITGAVEPGARVITDGWNGYIGLDGLGYTHERRSQRAARARGDDPGELLPAVHRVASLAKRWLLGTHQGSVEEAHLPAYLNEFAFRFNRRNSRSRGMLFYRVMELAAGHEPIRYADILASRKPRGKAPATRGSGSPPSLERPAANRPWRTTEMQLPLPLRLTVYPRLSLCRYPDKDNNTAERALRTPVTGRKNFYGSGAEWAAHLAADVWTVTATAARHDIEPLGLLTGYLHECARNGGAAPAGAGLDPFLSWTPRGRARRRPASDPGPGP